MADVSETRKSAHTALIEALEHVETMDDVLVLWTDKEGKVRHSSNDVTIGDSLFLIEVFRFLILNSGLGEG